jgi:hypothetical protein
VVTSSACACLLVCVAFSEPAKGEPPAAPKHADALPPVPAVANDAPALRKAQSELVQEGLTYIKRC